jgi:hypothetical protein
MLVSSNHLFFTSEFFFDLASNVMDTTCLVTYLYSRKKKRVRF